MSDSTKKAVEYLQPLARTASIARLVTDESSASGDSWFGRVTLAAADERWPIAEGRPMMPLLQLRQDELPYVPEALKPFALITVFLATDAEGRGIYPSYHISTENGEGWLLRAYTRLDGLLPLEPPTSPVPIKPRPIIWESVNDDFPCWEDLTEEAPEGLELNNRALYDLVGRELPTYEQTKVGGWPTCIQSSIELFDGYLLQIGTEDDAEWMWGDDGTAYLSLDEEGDWYIEWQTY